MTRTRWSACALVLCTCAQSAFAQLDSARGKSFTASALAESLSVLGQVERSVRQRPTDPSLWHRQGVLALMLATRQRERGAWRGRSKLELDALASKSFVTAVKLDSLNARHAMTLADYWQRGTWEETRRVPAQLAHTAMLARASADTATLIRALETLGFRWQQEPGRVPTRTISIAQAQRTNTWQFAGRISMTDIERSGRGASVAVGISTPSSLEPMPYTVWAAAALDTIRDLPKLLQTAISTVRRLDLPVPRISPGYGEAAARLEEVFALAPSRTRVFERLAEMYVAEHDWARLAMLAERQTRFAPHDPDGWLALGLARVRLTGPRASSDSTIGDAFMAFDSAFARLSPDVPAHLDRVDRVLTWQDSVTLSQSSAAAKTIMSARTWEIADPLWTTGIGKPRLEFLARLAYAELRWSGDSVHGADTRLGDLMVRYGPPDSVAGNYWIYRPDLIFSRQQLAHPESRVKAELEAHDLDERVEDWQPSRWNNVAAVRIDSMRTQVARFRSAPDSIELFVAARTPQAQSRADRLARIWLMAPDGTRLRDSSVVPSSQISRWTKRITPSGWYYRVESLAPADSAAGRSAGMLALPGDSTSDFALAGYGVSDVVLALDVTENANARRWSDFAFEPLAGSIPHGAKLSLLWETYDTGAVDSAARYGVKITIERKYSMFLNRLRARVISAWAAMMGSEQTSDRMVFRYERSATHANTVPDYVTVALEDTPAGNYDLTLEITDRATGKIASRTMRVTIDE